MVNEKLKAALDRLETDYGEISSIADSLVKPITERADRAIEYLNDHVHDLTIDQLREKLLELQLAAEGLSATREKTAVKADLATALKKEKSAVEFLSADGSVAAKQSAADLASQPEAAAELLSELVSGLIKTKVDQLQRLVQVLQSVLMSRMQETKYMNVGCKNDVENPF